jgi:AraC-like DNA-binding protein
MAQLASDVGHESDAAFARPFKRAFGTTPVRGENTDERT